MTICINRSKIKDFVIDSCGEVKSPMYFENTDISGKAKKILKILAKNALEQEKYDYNFKEFSDLLDENFVVITKKIVVAICELRAGGYLEIASGSNTQRAEKTNKKPPTG